MARRPDELVPHYHPATCASEAAHSAAQSFAHSTSSETADETALVEEFAWQAANYLLYLHFGLNDWLIRQHRKELSS